MSCLMTSPTRRSRSVPAAVLIASAAASSHEVLLVPMISVTLYTLITVSFDHVGPLRGCCGQPLTESVVDTGRRSPRADRDGRRSSRRRWQRSRVAGERVIGGNLDEDDPDAIRILEPHLDQSPRLHRGGSENANT